MGVDDSAAGVFRAAEVGGCSAVDPPDAGLDEGTPCVVSCSLMWVDAQTRVLRKRALGVGDIAMVVLHM